MNKTNQIIDYAWRNNQLFVLEKEHSLKIYLNVYKKVADKQAGYSLVKTYANDLTRINPWRIDCEDIDGDGIAEICLGVFKTTHFDENEGNRIFLFDFDTVLRKKWTGSKLGDVLIDYRFVENVNKDRKDILVISEDNNEKCKLLLCQWFDFGFVVINESEKYDQLVFIDKRQDELQRINYRIDDLEGRASFSQCKGLILRENSKE